MTKLGHYLDLPVFVEYIDSDDFIPKDLLLGSESVLFFCGENQKGCFSRFVNTLEEFPVVLMVGGGNTQNHFDEMLDVMSVNSQAVDVMTRMNDTGDFQESYEEFFQGVWPSESKYDQWDRYLIIMSDITEDLKLKMLKNLNMFLK